MGAEVKLDRIQALQRRNQLSAGSPLRKRDKLDFRRKRKVPAKIKSVTKGRRNRQQQFKAGTPHFASWHCWKKLFYSRIRLRTHILKKDIKRREVKAAAILAGEIGTRDTTRPSDQNENQDFWHAWNKAEARDWNELQEWSSTNYLRPGKLREPKPETNKARQDRRKRRMQEDPAYHEAVKAKEKQKRQDRKKRGKAKKAGAAAPSSDA